MPRKRKRRLNRASTDIVAKALRSQLYYEKHRDKVDAELARRQGAKPAPKDESEALEGLRAILAKSFTLEGVLRRIERAEKAVQSELGRDPFPDPSRVLEVAVPLGLLALSSPTVQRALEQLAEIRAGRSMREGEELRRERIDAAMRAYLTALVPVPIGRPPSRLGMDLVLSVHRRRARIAAETGRKRGSLEKAIAEEAAYHEVDPERIKQLMKREKRQRRPRIL